MTARPLKDTDSAHQVRVILIGAYSCATLIMGAYLGVLLFDWSLPLGFLVLGLPLSGVTFLIAYGIVEATGEGAARVYRPTGRSTPAVRRYSLIEAMAVRGETDRTIQAYLEAYSTDPSDPEPLLRIVGLTAKDDDRPDVTLRCLMKVAAIPSLPDKTLMFALRELIDWAERIGEPHLAVPALARAAHLHEGTRVGWRARKELRRLRGQTTDPD